MAAETAPVDTLTDHGASCATLRRKRALLRRHATSYQMTIDFVSTATRYSSNVTLAIQRNSVHAHEARALVGAAALVGDEAMRGDARRHQGESRLRPKRR